MPQASSFEATDPSGRTTQITLAGKTKTIPRDPRQQSTVFDYSHLPGLPTSLTDTSGTPGGLQLQLVRTAAQHEYNNHARVHSFTYNRNDNLTSETHPETGLISYTYYDTNWLSGKRIGAEPSHGTSITGMMGPSTWSFQGDGSSTENEIWYLYGTTGRMIRVNSYIKNWRRDPIKYDSYGNITEETIIIPGLPAKTIKYECDRNNNLGRPYPDPSPNQNYWAKTTYNGLLMPERVTFNNDNNVLKRHTAHRKLSLHLNLVRNGTLFSASYFPSGELDSTSLTRARHPALQRLLSLRRKRQRYKH